MPCDKCLLRQNRYYTISSVLLIKWLDDNKVKIENLSDKYILFGIIRCEDEIFVNHILLLAKQYLYSSRQDRSNIHPTLEFLITGLTLFS